MKKSLKFLLLLLTASTLLTSCHPDSPSPETTTAPTTEQATPVKRPSSIPGLVWDSENVKLELETYSSSTKTQLEIIIKKSGNFVEAYYHKTQKKDLYTTYYQWYTVYVDLAKNEIYYPNKDSDSSNPYAVAKIEGATNWQAFLYVYRILSDSHVFAFQDDNYIWIDDKNYAAPVDVLESIKTWSLTSLKVRYSDNRATISGATPNGSGTLTVISSNPTVRLPKADPVNEPFSLTELQFLSQS